MKKVLIVAAAAGLMTLAACSPSATNNATEATNDAEANAGAYDDAANATVDENAAMANTSMNEAAPANAM